MAFQSVPNTVQITVVYQQNFETMQNTFYAKFGGVYQQADLQALADNIDVTVGTFWRPIQTQDCSYIRTEVLGLEFENDLTAESAVTAGPGTDVDEGLPNSVTIAIKKSSGLTGRSARGRNYWMGMPAGELAGNENLVKDDYVTSVEVALDLIRTATDTTLSFEAVLVSRFANGVARAFGITFKWLSTTCVNAFVDTQRGRLSN